MNSVGFFEKLQDEVEVVWQPLGEIGEFVRGKRFVKTDIISNGVPCIHYGEMYTHFGISAKETKSFLDAELASKLRVANQGDVIIVAAGETIEDIGNGTAWIGEEDVVIHDACFAYKSKLNPTYVSYFLRTKIFKDQIKKHISSGKISSINSSGLGKANIPIPCPRNPERSLEIQVKIVRILDAFTELTSKLASELTAELTARKKKYNYYRDQLLSFEEGEVEWKTLGETCDVYTGGEAPESSSMSKTPTDVYKYPIYGNGAEVYGYTNSYRIDRDAVTISSIGANTGTVYFRKAYFTPIIRLKVLMPKHDLILPRYIFHALSSISIGSKSSSVPNMNAADVKRISIPVPSVETQARIVAILDKFNTLTNSITEGLPREIELRQKQYEYYRDLLLSFPKPESVEA